MTSPKAPPDPLSALVGLRPRMDADAVLAESRGPGWRSELDEKPRGHAG